MNEDTYFMKKAEELRNKIQDAKIDSKHLTFEQIDEIIYIAMKEVARDQRYACVEAFDYECRRESVESGNIDGMSFNQTRISGIIQNATI